MARWQGRRQGWVVVHAVPAAAAGAVVVLVAAAFAGGSPATVRTRRDVADPRATAAAMAPGAGQSSASPIAPPDQQPTPPPSALPLPLTPTPSLAPALPVNPGLPVTLTPPLTPTPPPLSGVAPQTLPAVPTLPVVPTLPAVVPSGPAASTSAGPPSQTVPTPRPTPRVQPVTFPLTGGPITTTVTLPAGFAQPQGLTSDPTRPGVWFESDNAAGVTLFFWDAAAGVLRQYPLGPASAHNLSVGIALGLAVAPDGTVWLGTNSTLVELDPATGATTFLTVPPTPENPAAGAYFSGELQGYDAIQSLAVDAQGDVAMVQATRAVVTVYHQATGMFTTVPLPAGAEPQAVAYLPDGTLGVAETNWAPQPGVPSGQGEDDLVTVVFPDGAQADVTAAGSVAIGAAGKAFLLPAGQSGYQAVTPSGATATAAVANGVDTDATLITNLAPVALPGGRLVVASNGGSFVAVDPATGLASTVALPTFTCSTDESGEGFGGPRPGQAPDASPTTQPGPLTCHDSIHDFVADPAGNVWFTSGVGVQEVPASAFR